MITILRLIFKFYVFLDFNHSRVFDFANHETAVRASNMIQGCQFCDQEFAIFFHVFYHNFQDVIVVAAHVMTLQDFLELDDITFKFGQEFFGVLNEPDVAKNHESFFGLRAIEQNHVFVDNAFPFQFFDAFVNCRYRKVEF